ncbi:MAG: CHASE3 domain-containing protein [Rhizobiaceae bacterium]
MPRFHIGRLLLLVAGLCVLAALALAAIWIARNNDAEWKQANALRNTIAEYYHAVVSAERAQRAFILTEDGDYLLSYLESKNRVSTIRAELKDLVGARPALVDELATLFKLTEERNAQLDLVLLTFSKNGFEAAVAALRGNEVKRTTGRIFAIAQSIVDQETGSLMRHQQRFEFLILSAMSLMALLALFGLAVAGVALNREISRRQALAQINQELEQLVEERAEAIAVERSRVEELLDELSGYEAKHLATISRWLAQKAEGGESAPTHRPASIKAA